MKVKFAGSCFVLPLSFLFLLGCGGIRKMNKNIDEVKVYTEPEVLEVHGDSVEFTIKGEFPEGYFDKNGIVKFEPVLYHDTGDIVLTPFYAIGEKAELSDEDKEQYEIAGTINKKSGGTVEKSYKIPYQPNMKNCELEAFVAIKIESKYDQLDRCVVPSDPDSVSRGTITTSLTVKPLDHILIGGVEPAKSSKGAEGKEGEGVATQTTDDTFKPKAGKRVPAKGYVVPDKTSTNATILFDINRSYIRSSVKSGEEMERIRNWARQEKLVVNGAVIESFASPDGELELNANLTKERAKSTFEYLKGEFADLGYDEINDSNFYRKASTEEDWDGFKKLIRASEIENKNEILGIANSNLPLDEKEASIREMDSWEPYIVDSIMPDLRRSEIKVLGYYRVKSYDTIKAHAERYGYDTLNRKELVLLAYNSNDVDEKEKIYNHYKKRFPDDWIGHNNSAALLLFEARYEEAYEVFTKLNKQFPGEAYIQNNLGVASRHMREYEKARENYMSAKGKGVDERNNLGILDIKIGDYPSAISNFPADQCDYNTALAYHLNDDFDKALEELECIANKTADHFYLRAVVAANQEDTDLMTTSLRRAVEMDGDIRERAKKDLEFRNYWDSEEFKNALRY